MKIVFACPCPWKVRTDGPNDGAFKAPWVVVDRHGVPIAEFCCRGAAYATVAAMNGAMEAADTIKWNEET